MLLFEATTHLVTTCNPNFRLSKQLRMIRQKQNMTVFAKSKSLRRRILKEGLCFLVSFFYDAAFFLPTVGSFLLTAELSLLTDVFENFFAYNLIFLLTIRVFWLTVELLWLQ